jgi:predicted signal transduction protein with EAL and GGDEF domain
VAEGVEDAESFRKLSELGCDYAQGYYLSRPLAPDKATVWLEVFGGAGKGDGDEAEQETEKVEDETLSQWVVEAPAGDLQS